MEIRKYIHKIQSFVSSCPEKVLIVDEYATRKTTCAEFWSLTEKIAAQIRTTGSEGRMIPVVLPDCMEYFAAEIAIWMTGNCAVNLGTSFPKDSIDYIMQHCEAEWMIDSVFIEKAKQLAYGCADIYARKSSQPCAMFYTSGSTGHPKGVLHSDAGFLKGILIRAKIEKPRNYGSFATIAPNYFVAVTGSFGVLYMGKTLHILPKEVKTDPFKLTDYITDNAIEKAFINPSILQVLQIHPKSLKIISTGGERLVGCFSKDYRLYNCYGQTETAGIIMIKQIDKGYDNSPVGTPLPGIEVCLLDNEGNEVPEGEVGELCIKSGFPMPEYFKEPERTRELLQGGVQHTGDLMKRLPNGDYLYVQRKDWMAKINGQRVEPGQVETVMKRIPGIKNAIVKSFTTDDLSRQYLVGYYILSPDSALDPGQIEIELKKTLPAYMVPAYMVQMESFPLNASLKVDRKSLKSPAATTIQSDYASPTNQMERALCEAFGKVLGLERVGIDDDFTRLGGDSIRLMQLQQALRFDVPANIVLSKGTPRMIAEYIAKDTGHKDNTSAMTDFPLNPAQTFFLQQALAAPDSSASYFPLLHRLPLCVDVERLKKAVEATVNAHPGMMLRVVTDGNGDFRMRPSTEPWHLNVEKMSDSEFERLRPNLFHCFRYLEEMLFEVRLISTESAVYLYYNMHHIITDGMSNSMFVSEISQAYSGNPIPREEQTIFEFNAELERVRHTSAYEECKEWFVREFEGSCGGKDTVAEGEMKTYKSILNIPSHKQMDGLCQKYGITLNVLFMASIAKSLDRHDGKRDVRMTASFHGRLSQKCQRTFGFLAAPRLYRFHWDEQQSMADYLMQSKNHIMGNMARAAMPAAEVLQRLKLPMDATMFIYQGLIGTNPLILGDVVARTEMLPTDTPDTQPLCMFIYDVGESEFSIEVWYDSSKYTQAYIESLVSDFESIIRKL